MGINTLGKKFNLQQKSQNIFQRQKNGSPATKLEQQRVMNTIIEDLDRLRRLPRDFRLITPNDIEHLVNCWKKRSLSTATITNKLGVLRRLNQLADLNLNIPSNKELNSIKTSTTPLNMAIPKDYEKNIFHPLTKSVIALQLHFGLTKLEAIRLNSTCACVNNILLIERTIAHNKKDRTIPITTKIQIETINERNRLIQTSPLLKLQTSDSVTQINRLYMAECCHADISPKTPFRKHYAQTRLKLLEETQDKQSALLTLCLEMGFCAPRKMLGLL